MIDQALPLIDLHRHLDGNVRLKTILDLGRQYNRPLPAWDLESLRPHVQVMESPTSQATMPGVMFWPYYRTEADLTPDYVAKLVDHYYYQGKTSYFGDGNTRQLIANAQLETLTGLERSVGAGGSVELFSYSSVPGIQNDHDDHGQASHGQKGLKMVRGSEPNAVAIEVSGIDTDMVYTVSAWVMAQTTGNPTNTVTPVLIGCSLRAMLA